MPRCDSMPRLFATVQPAGLRATPSALASDEQERLVVRDRTAAAEAVELVEAARDEVRGGERAPVVEQALQALEAEQLAAAVAALDHAVGVEREQPPVVQVREVAPEAGLRQRPEHGPARAQERAALLADEQRRVVAGVVVEEAAVLLELAVEERGEARGERARVQHAVELRERVRGLELLLHAH